ncbi:hypothetical protein [Pseudonocardia sp.]|uniref:hypothetical protein n=1 Tax=Pseudonocardia sp. TaxID=60912 RepID=UPI0026344760|nr:hypothetical protein [Pseudonocardia sp.]
MRETRLLAPTPVGAPLVRVTAVAVAGALAVPAASGIRPWTSGLLAVLTVALCVWGLVAAFDRGARLAQLVFWAFSLAWLGVAPLYQLAVGQVAWGDRSLLAMRDAVTSAQLLVLLSLAAFLAGSHLPIREVRRVADLDPVRTVRAAGVVVGLAVLLLPLAARAGGGFASLFVSRQERSAAIDAAGVVAADGGGATLGLVTLLPAALATVGCYFAILALREHARRSRLGEWPVRAVVVALAGVAMLLTYSNPVANSRFISFAAIGCCALAALAPRSVRAGAALAGSAVVGLLFAYPILYALRKPGGLAGDSPFSLADWAGPDFDGFQQWTNTVLFVGDRGPEWGRTILSALLFWVPRSVWDGKSVPASITVAEYRGYGFTDLSLPVSAELYLNFGVAGVVVGMVALGALWARLDHAWLTAPGSLLAVLAPVVATQQFGLIRGPMGSLAPVIGSVVLLSLAVVAYSGRRERGGDT